MTCSLIYNPKSSFISLAISFNSSSVNLLPFSVILAVVSLDDSSIFRWYSFIFEKRLSICFSTFSIFAKFKSYTSFIDLAAFSLKFCVASKSTNSKSPGDKISLEQICPSSKRILSGKKLIDRTRVITINKIKNIDIFCIIFLSINFFFCIFLPDILSLLFHLFHFSYSFTRLNHSLSWFRKSSLS